METRTPPFRFGVFEVDRASGELRKHGVRIKLPEQPLQALMLLLARPGELVTREELRNCLWPPGVLVDFDRGLNKAINRLRDALGDDADTPRFVETLPQRGYRFIAPVESGIAASEPPTSTDQALAVVDRTDSPISVLPGAGIPRRRTLLLIGGGIVAATVGALGLRRVLTPSLGIESLAVLPLANLSGDPAQEYFSDGMTDELIGEIAQIASLRVISRTSVMRYKNSGKGLPEIARELNVDAIVEGTVSQSGGKVRITAQLIRAADDRHLWAGRYERDVTNVLAMQDEVARAIVGQIRTKVEPLVRAGAARNRPVNPEAYTAYLQGDFFLHKGAVGVDKSIEFFARAIKLDSLHADSHAGLAQALIYAGIFGLRSCSETHPEARLAALTALELDPSNAAAHNALADVKKAYDWDLAAAQVEYRQALRLNPSHLLSRLWYAECLSLMRRFDESIAESRRAVVLDPVSAHSHNVLAMLLWRAGRNDEAILSARHALELDAARSNALWWQGLAYATKRDFARSIECLTAARSFNNSPMTQGFLGHVYALAGERAKAAGILRDLAAASKRRYVNPIDFAVVYSGLNDAGKTFEWLEKGYRDRSATLQQLGTPLFAGLRSDSRYDNLLKRVGLPPLAPA